MEKVLVHSSLAEDGRLFKLQAALRDAGTHPSPTLPYPPPLSNYLPPHPARISDPNTRNFDANALRVTQDIRLTCVSGSQGMQAHTSWCTEVTCQPTTPAEVTIYGGERATAVLSLPRAVSDKHEYGDMALTLELVDSIDEAIDHIHANGSGHTECIITGGQPPPSHFHPHHVSHHPHWAAMSESWESGRPHTVC